MMSTKLLTPSGWVALYIYRVKTTFCSSMLQNCSAISDQFTVAQAEWGRWWNNQIKVNVT